MDARKDRVQPVRLSKNFFPLDIHKSMFINDLTITLPAYYVKSWGNDILDTHNKDNYKWEIDLNYESPRGKLEKNKKFKAILSLSFSKNRSKESSYRIKWDKEFAVQLAKDYPKSFVRALEFHIGDEHYKKLKFTEFDVGGFKEQLQVKISWDTNKPKVVFKEFFRIRDESQDFPMVYNELSSYLIADYLLSDQNEIARRIQISDWKPRSQLNKELNENNIYILFNREKKEFYIGETKKSLSQRYPRGQKHHSFEDWNEFIVIQLPTGTSDQTRILIERVLISSFSIFFSNKLNNEKKIFNDISGIMLMNKKK